jgi:nucleotide-binding universal stress UspA family protein
MKEWVTPEGWKRKGPAAGHSVGGDPTSVGPVVAPFSSRGIRLPWLRNLLVAAKMNVTGVDTIKAGAALAKRTGADLSVISVIKPSMSLARADPEEGSAPEWVESEKNRIRRFVETELAKVGCEAKLVHVSSGNPANIIAIFAEQTASDLLMLGTHRSSGFGSILPGSAGEGIVRESEIPVLSTSGGGIGPFKRILIPVDLSRRSQSLLDWARRLAWVDGAEIRVIHSEGLVKRLWLALTFRGDRTFRGQAWRRFMRRFWESDFPGQPQIVVRRGHPGRAVLREARTWDADLLVIGTRRLNLPFVKRLGRTAKYLLRHGGRSILAIPD